MVGTIETQVAVVGSGPAGLTLASLLHKRGVACVVIDKFDREQLLARARAGFLERRTVQLLDRLGVSKRLRTEGLPHTACEFRCDGEIVRLDYTDLCGDTPSFVYPQQEVVADLLDGYESAGGSALLGRPVVELGTERGLPVVRCADGTVVRAEVVVEAAGQYGPVRAALPAGAFTEYDVRHGVRLLGVLAQTPPFAPHTIYGQHTDGFAGQMLRSPDVTRLYLEVADDEGLADWPEERIWRELDGRLALSPGTLRRGPVLERSLVEMRTWVVEPMHLGRVALVGDAAHIVPPSGGKGMNLAMADAADLAAALGRHFRDGAIGDVGEVLAAYSRRRLADVWQVQEFSHFMLHLQHGPRPGTPDAGYVEALRRARLFRLRDDPAYARAFLERYMGPELAPELASDI
ncbi:4-hydroxybenzoate 3-monooxygenase [Streptomyces olivaceiscleroticus]|uniref:4-hydroxybenzoate 3-monooxygenase n=1 Tax=Streptomyces olivaceiscleroticus TaxID=68245 RepID=A0ABN0ZJG6_9ACTN